MRADPQSHSPIDGSNAATSSSLPGTGGQDAQQGERPGGGVHRMPTAFPSFDNNAATAGRAIQSSNDGVFANLNAKPERGEKNEDMPPVCYIMMW